MNEINMYRGNDRTIAIVITDKSTGLPYNLENCTINMYVKVNIDDDDSQAVIFKTTEDNEEGIIVNAANGLAEFYLIPDDTNDAIDILRNSRPYPVEFRVIPSNEKIYTVLRTWLTILT
jgi:hypothetical protein